MTGIDWEKDKLREKKKRANERPPKPVRPRVGDSKEGRKPLRLKFSTSCQNCLTPIRQGQWAWWRPGSALCKDCGMLDENGNLRRLPKSKVRPT